MAFDLTKLLTDVFDPQAGEVVTVACDVPRKDADDTDAWRQRRAMADEWQQAFVALGRGRGFEVNPLLTFPATGANGDLSIGRFLKKRRERLHLESVARIERPVGKTEIEPFGTIADQLILIVGLGHND